MKDVYSITTVSRFYTLVAWACVTLLASTLFGCGGGTIPNTDVEDTRSNRSIVEFVERYRKAVEARDVARLIAMASPMYLDDNGTPNGNDDIDYKALKEKLRKWKSRVSDVRYEIRYRQVTYKPKEIWVDYTYTGNFKVTEDQDGGWARRLADNRLVLSPKGDSFRILSGM